MIGDALKQAMDPYGSLADSLEQELKKPVRPKVPKGMSASRPKASYSALADSLERELQKPSQVKVPSGMASAGARVGTAAGEVGLSYIPPELEALPNPMGGPPILKGIPGKGKTGMTALEAGTKLNQKQEELAQRLSFLDYFSPFKGTPVAGLTSPSHLAAGAVMAPVQTAASGMILTAPESSWQDRVGAATEILTNFVGPAEVLSGFKILGKPAFNTLLKAVGMKNTPLKRLYLRQLLSDAEKSGINVGKLMQGMEHPGVSVGAKAGIPKMAQVPEGIAGKAKGRAPKTAVPEPPVKPAEVGGGKEPWEMTREEFQSHRRANSPSQKNEYRGGHEAPMEADDTASPLWNVAMRSFPEDIYEGNALRLYGFNEPRMDSEALSIIRAARNNSNAEITIYRAVPKEVKGTGDQVIKPGDWVAITRQYAKEHGEGNLNGSYRIVSKKVKARDVYTNGDSIQEWGYDPQGPDHRSYVARALKYEKPVPPEVLADYPDLAAKYPQAKSAPTAKPTPEAPKRGLEDVGGAGTPRLRTLVGEIPKPFKAEPKPAAGPKRVSEVGPKATGLANQVQARKTIEGVLEDIEPTKGKGPEHWQSVGKKAVDDLEYDPNILADRIARGEEELTGKKVGVLLEGARIHENKVNQAAKAVDDAIAKGGDVQGARKAYQEAQEAYQNFAEQVQQGKGRWSDVGRALQAGTELDTGNYAQVIQAAKRAGNVGPKLEAQLQKQSATIADLNEKLAAKDAEIAKARAEGGVTRATARKATRQAIQQEREAIFKEIDDLFKEAAGAGLHAPASAAYTAVKAGSKLAAAGGKLALNYAKEGITLIDEIAERVIRDFRSKGLEIDRQTIIDEMAKPQRQTKTKNEIQKALMSLRAQVKRESTANKAKIQGEIESLQKQLETGDFRTPSKREMILSKELEALRAERDLHAARVRSAIHSLGQSTAKKVTQEVAGAVRGTILGTDFGILTRQGLFGLSRPVSFAKSTGKAVQAMLSEKNLVRIENDILSHDVAGQTAGVVYRKHGLGLSSYLTHPEELVVGKLIRRIPGIGRLAGTLERGQSAFINTLRSEMFDRAIRLGYKDNELLARANFINSATGRSNAKNIPTALEFIMTSPRYERSRWEMLAQPLRNPAVIIKDLATKKGLNRGAVDNLQDMAVTAAEVYGLYKLAEASGYTTNFDPTSSDFLKMRKGDEVWDPSAGIAPRLRDMMRFVAWSMEPSYHDNVLKVIGQSAVRPLSPSIRQPLEVGSQQVQRLRGVPEDKMASVFTGWKLDEDEKGWITFAPLIVQTVKKYLDKGDAQGAMDAAWKEFIGQSVNRYAPPKPAK